jgi:hypothetical protein
MSDATPSQILTHIGGFRDELRPRELNPAVGEPFDRGHRNSAIPTNNCTRSNPLIQRPISSSRLGNVELAGLHRVAAGADWRHRRPAVVPCVLQWGRCTAAFPRSTSHLEIRWAAGRRPAQQRRSRLGRPPPDAARFCLRLRQRGGVRPRHRGVVARIGRICAGAPHPRPLP